MSPRFLRQLSPGIEDTDQNKIITTVITLHCISKQVYAKTGRIACPIKCPEVTKVPSKNAANLKNNFYLLPKVQKRIAKEQMKLLMAMVAETKENQEEDLAVRRQTLIRLEKARNILRSLDAKIQRLVHDQNQTMATIQFILDNPDNQMDLALKEQYEDDLLVKICRNYLLCFFLFFGSSFLFL